MAYPSLLCYHNLYSMLGAVERDFFPSAGVHPEHRVTSDHENQPELVCSSSDPPHSFKSFDSYGIVYAQTRDRRETRVLFLFVYLAYKEDSSKKNQKQ